jgi:hypothetical protein
MGNILATPPAANYRRTLSGSNRVKAIQKLDSESIDLFYVLYVYFIIVLSAIAVIYFYSIRAEGVPRFKGDAQSGKEPGLWTRFIRWLQETPASRRCSTRVCPTISVRPENQPTEPSTNNLCQSGTNSNPNAGDCIV